MGDALELLRDIERTVHDEFVANRRVLSFDEYVGLVSAEPGRHTRTVAAYVRDCLDYYGSYQVDRPGGSTTRYALFDCPWESADDDGVRHRVVGHEEAQQRFYRMLVNFLREGRVTRLVLLHGPNGSAKSSFIRCLADGLEQYSKTDEGAIYRFNWVFPSNRLSKKRLGFADGAPVGPIESFAHLDETDIDARLQGDLRDHPLLVLPRDKRARLFATLRESGALPASDTLGQYLVDGDLSPRSRAIADALLSAYHGDFQRVMQHVQVERFYFSRRYRVGVVTIEPQLHVDATMRQITMDQGLQALPPSLRSLNLFEAGGDLVDANRGLIEYNDLLKKPLDTYKYLLATCEKGTVALPSAILHLDLLFLASSNEKHLNGFKEYQDFSSFKGRMDLVKMPYLRNYKVELDIYDEQIARGALSGKVAPHTSYVVALWGILTRLCRPDASRYPAPLRDVIAKLTPMEKAELYAGEREPAGLTPELSRLLWSELPALLEEGQEDAAYEGSFGASPREMKETMLNALQNPRYHGCSPLGVLDELRQLVKLHTVFEFLQRDADGGYHDHAGFIEQVQARWLGRVDDEVRASMGLVSAEQYDDLVARYIRHVSYSLKKEKVYDEAAGRSEEPDKRLMDQLEGVWKVGSDRETFRQNLIGRIGAWRIDFPGQPIDYRRLFPTLFHALEQDYFEQQRGTIRRLCEHVLAVLSEDPKHKDALAPGDRERAEASIERLRVEFGYSGPAAREAVGALLLHRY
jgi:serine protein kinase